MTAPQHPNLPVDWPPPADRAAGERLFERFCDTGSAAAACATDPAFAAMLRCLGGNSGYLADAAIREAAALMRMSRDGPDAVVAAALAAIAETSPQTPRREVAARLRAAKRVVALVTAVADIGDMWKLDAVTAALSDLAEAALRLAVAHLLRTAHESGEMVLPWPDRPETGSGFVVLGMGKLGARELNYSSDVDLVLLHNPDQGVYHGDSAGSFFTRLARDLVALMEARDADGYVFRTDLRLRPDPAATPPCMALPAAIAYYESMGQNWERAAMLKARPVAGDHAMGEAFIAAIRPFVWRRHLDFAAVADIAGMKRRIDAHKGTGLAEGTDPVARIAGHDVKLGQGGIREIEFVAQTLQLVWGGRNPALRIPRTLDALALLAKSSHLPVRAAAELADAYRFLRRVEHRLQMVADRQTHSLPETRDGLERFALFLGQPDAAAFATLLLRHLGRVRTHYRALFESVPDDDPNDPACRLDFGEADAVPAETAAKLTRMGFHDPASIGAVVRGWRAGRLRALRSPRARALLEQVLPGLLRAIATQPDPDAAFRRFDSFLARQPSGVHLMSLFQHNPALLARIAAVLGAAPTLADHLATTPSALEGLLAPDETADPAAVLRIRLAAAATLEESVAVIRRTVREEDFRIAVATMEGRIDADAAGLARTALADAALTALLPRVIDDFATRNGRVAGGGMVVVLLGKAGGREMMAGSDLDLMVVYDHPPDVIESSGERRLAASQWFIRAVHAYVAALTAPDAEGPMYAVDMRLRPSGNKGPVAVSLASFERYHAPAAETPGAWTWERMALTRARVIAGPAALQARVAAAIRVAIAAADPAKVRADAASMRGRLARELPPHGPWDAKFRVGGQIEVEFIAQALQLLHPAAADPTTRVALGRLRDAGVLAAEDADLLIHADHVWRSLQGLLRITSGRSPAATLPEATASTLLRVMAPVLVPDPPVDLAGLHTILDRVSQQVRAAFVRRVGEIDP